MRTGICKLLCSASSFNSSKNICDVCVPLTCYKLVRLISFRCKCMTECFLIQTKVHLKLPSVLLPHARTRVRLWTVLRSWPAYYRQLNTAEKLMSVYICDRERGMERLLRLLHSNSVHSNVRELQWAQTQESIGMTAGAVVASVDAAVSWGDAFVSYRDDRYWHEWWQDGARRRAWAPGGSCYRVAVRVCMCSCMPSTFRRPLNHCWREVRNATPPLPLLTLQTWVWMYMEGRARASICAGNLAEIMWSTSCWPRDAIHYTTEI